jgi:hypothetical protein
MEIKKYIAALLTSLMAVSTFVGAVLAANDLSGFPGFLFSKTATASTPAYLMVVGKDAKPSDVVGAIDVASRLAEGSYTIEKVTGAAAPAAVTGVERDDIGLYEALSTHMPSTGVMQNFHYSGLKDSTFTWRGDSYDFHEQVNIAGVSMRHDYGTSGINGTEKMEIESGDVYYEYVFDKALTGTGSISSPNYTYPIYIDLLGKTFAIVGTGSDSTIKVLQGSIGTATDKVPVTYGDYSVYSDLGSNDAWARIIVKDKAGNTVGTKTIDKGSSWDFTDISLTVKVTAVRALSDGTIVGVDLVAGPTGQVEKTYDTSADTTSTGTASDRFPGETDWGIKTKSGTFTTAGQIAAGDTIQVVYQPTATVYLVAGEKLVLPNNYAELGFEGWNTDKFATITVRPVSNLVGYSKANTDTQVASGLNGFEITTDVSHSIGGVVGSNWYSKAYALIKYGSVATNITVYYGFYDESSGKVLVNATQAPLTESATANAEYYTIVLNGTDATAGGDVTYPFKLRYGGVGDKEFTLKVKFDSGAADIVDVIVNDGSTDQITYDYENKTALSTSATPEFRLGGTAASAEDTEVSAKTETTSYNIGKASQDVVVDGGIIALSPATYGAADKAVFKIPAKDLKVKVYFGKMGAAAAAPGEVTYNKVAPIKTAVAKLDSEIGDAEKATYHLVLVGGPCVNSLVADLKKAGYFEYGCADWPAENFALVKVIDNAFNTGKVAVVIAGTRAEDTRLACSVMQNYDAYKDKLVGTKVKITGTITAPSIVPA